MKTIAELLGFEREIFSMIERPADQADAFDVLADAIEEAGAGVPFFLDASVRRSWASTLRQPPVVGPDVHASTAAALDRGIRIGQWTAERRGGAT